MRGPVDSKRKWTLREADETAVGRLVAETGLSQLVARLLVARGIAEPAAARRFLEPDLDRDWRDPSALPGMDACAARVADAVAAGERIVVFGDYDADGITAAALLSAGLRRMGGDVEPLLPRRFDEGYGLTRAAVARILECEPDLVVTVDCGISAAPEVAALLASGIGVVVTDHHDPSGDVPEGVPLVDPKLPGYPFDGLAGAGVALKLLQAVGGRCGRAEEWRDFVDLAAVGTIADVVPLLDENRALVAEGLRQMGRRPRAGIAALASVCDARGGPWTTERVSYGVAPRLNAAGRVADPAQALELLMTDDPARADQLARALDELNRLRQSLEQELLAAASELANAGLRDGDRAIVLAGDGWHEGVRGIVAGRLASTHGLPAIVLCVDGEEATGSGRSIPGVDLNEALGRCSHLLTRHGGHPAAVGLSLPVSRVDAFRDELQGVLAALPGESFVPRLELDGEVPLADLDRDTAAQIALLEPFGEGNPRPLLASRGVFMQARRRVGANGDHLKFDAYDGLAALPAIAFRLPGIERAVADDGAVDLAYHLEIDEWRGRERVQLKVRDVAFHDRGEDGPAAELVEGLFAEADRILARGEYEGIADAESFHTKLAGVTFEGRQERIALLEPGTPLRLDRQPDNPHDTCACALHEPGGEQVGFLNRRLAAVLAPAIDGGAAYRVTVTEVTGGSDGASLGVNVLVERRTDPEAQEACEEARERREALALLDASELDAELVRHFVGDRPLREAQARSLEHLAAGRGCLTVMATGGGKSLIFHLHAAREAIARGRASLFVYPLRALVADQAFHLEEAYAPLGLDARLITGETSPSGRDETFAALAAGEVDVLMTTPEFLERHAARFAECGRVGFVVIDEAHHIGLARAAHRPAYARLGEALAALGSPVTLATTATAGPDTAQAIEEALGTRERVLDPSVRDNLRISDHRGLPDKVGRIASLAATGEKVVVYVNSREQSVSIARRLREASASLTHAVAFYNGGVARAARHAIERAFRSGDVRVIVATSAFGEGVNIPDIRHVVLFHLPFNRVEFNQMCGRAGRDGREAQVHLLFSEKDARVNEMILEASAPDLDDLRALYGVLRAEPGDEEGWIEVTNAELAQKAKERRRACRLSDRGASAGIGIFREIGLVTGEGAGSMRRLRLLEAPADKLDIPSVSVRYAEGLEEASEFAEFRSWVLSAPASELLAAFDRPILPS